MRQQDEQQLFRAVRDGDERAFERVYALYEQRVRLMAWRVARRADRIDDLCNETWCRAFANRRDYNGQTPFLVWLAGILRNVGREQARKRVSPGGASVSTEGGADRLEEATPEGIAAEAEALAGLNDCVSRLSATDQSIVRLRFFENRTLKQVAQELTIPESTLRDSRMPALMESLRLCLEKRGLDFSIFSALGAGKSQGHVED
jgi:RNA polymerase sigma factor (sigma-70 family)